APVNTAYTEREVNHALTLSESRFLVIEHEFLPVFEAIAETPILPENTVVIGGPTDTSGYRAWDTLQSTTARPTGNNAVEPGTLLNVQFTSGTTGFAKGCMLT